MLEAIALVASFVGIMISSYVFTENLEKLFSDIGFSMRTIGSVIAPLFTSAPELVIIIISLLILSKDQSEEVINGVVLGEPFTVLSLGLFLFSIFIFKIRTPNKEKVQNVELFLYIAISSLIIFFGKWISYGNYISAIFLVSIYIITTLGSSRKNESYVNEADENYNYFKGIMLVILSGILLMISSYFLLHSIKAISTELKIPTFYASLILIPIGTILPELMNSIFWGRKGKLELAIGNMVGESLIFIIIYPALALFLGFFYYSLGTFILLMVIFVNSVLFYLGGRFLDKYNNIFLMGLLFYILYMVLVFITK